MEGAMAGLFQVLWGEAGGKFKQAAVLNGTDRKPLIIPIKDKSEQTENICTRPFCGGLERRGEIGLGGASFKTST
jgi:hypothetical protein